MRLISSCIFSFYKTWNARKCCDRKLSICNVEITAFNFAISVINMFCCSQHPARQFRTVTGIENRLELLSWASLVIWLFSYIKLYKTKSGICLWRNKILYGGIDSFVMQIHKLWDIVFNLKLLIKYSRCIKWVSSTHENIAQTILTKSFDSILRKPHRRWNLLKCWNGYPRAQLLAKNKIRFSRVIEWERFPDQWCCREEKRILLRKNACIEKERILKVNSALRVYEKS